MRTRALKPSYDDNQIEAKRVICVKCKKAWFMTHRHRICAACRKTRPR